MGDEAEDLALEMHRRVRQRVLRRLMRSDARLSQQYRAAAGRIRRRLRAFGMTDEQVATVLQEELSAVEERLLPHVEREIQRAATAGDAAARQLLERLAPPPASQRPFLSAPASRPQQIRALRLISGFGGSSPETD